MKILMLTPYLPYPLLSGGQIRTYNLLKNLSSKHDITLFSFIRKQPERRFIPELAKFCRQVKVFIRRPAWDLRNLLLAGFTSYPFLVAIYLSRKLKTQVSQALATQKYDLIHAETFYVMPNIPKTSTPIILVEQTIEYLGYQTFANQTKLFPLKPFLLFDVLKIKYWEKHFWRKAQRLVTMSQEDKTFILDSTHQKIQVDVVANGVDIDYFDQTRKVSSPNSTVLFVGNFKWLPNRDAATFLARTIWPLIKSRLPQARLKIVGANPTREIKSLANIDGVSVTGDVPDIRTAFSNATVLLAPIRNGRGTRYKILESMASQTPVVATNLAVEGLNIKPGIHALISDHPHTLADYTLKVLRDAQLRTKLAENGSQLVKKQYDWRKISRDLDRIYQELGKS